MADTDTAALVATPDGMTLASWYGSRDVSRSTAFRLVMIAGLELAKVRVPEIRTPVAWLEQEQVQVLDQLAQRLAHGESLAKLQESIALVASPGMGQDGPGQHPETSQDGPGQHLETSRDGSGPATLLARLQAAQLAISTRVPLTSADVAWLIGAKPGAAITQRGGVIARRHARNVWTLEPADHPGMGQDVPG